MRLRMRRISLLLLIEFLVGVSAPDLSAQPPAPATNGLRTSNTASENAKKQEAEPSETETPVPEVDPALKKALGSPRATMQTFLEAMKDNRGEDAARCLDLSQLAATNEARETKEQELAYKLREVLKKLVPIEPTRYPEEADPDANFSLSETHNTDEADRPIAEQIVISKSPDGLWRFSADTVAAIEQLHEDLLERENVT